MRKSNFLQQADIVWSAALIACAALSACGGGGEPGNAGLSPDNLSPGGAYTLQLTLAPGAVPDTGTALITESGSGWVHDETDGTLYFVNSVTSGSTLAGSFRAYSPPGFLFLNGSPVLTGDISGIVAERSQIFGSASSSLGTSQYVLTYVPAQYGLASSFSTIAGVYQYVLGGVGTVTLSIDGDGRLTASDTSGCSSNGAVAIPDSRYNAYSFTAINQCPGFPAQPLSGFARFVPAASGLPARLVIAYSDGAQFATYAEAVKQ